jgi:hypothetical protein
MGGGYEDGRRENRYEEEGVRKGEISVKVKRRVV